MMDRIQKSVELRNRPGPRGVTSEGKVAYLLGTRESFGHGLPFGKSIACSSHDPLLQVRRYGNNSMSFDLIARKSPVVTGLPGY